MWPEYIVQTSGGDALWAFLTMMGVAMGLTLLQVLWVRLVDRSSYVAALQDTWSTTGLWIIVPIATLLCLGGESILLFLFAAMLHTFFYPKTPIMVMIVVIAIASSWVAIRSLTTIARTVQFWFPLILSSVLFVVLLSLTNLRFFPAMRPSFTLVVPEWAQAGLGTWFLYANGGLVASLVPHIRWTGPPRPALWAMLAIFFQGSILVLLYLLLMVILGPTAVARLNWPIMYMFGLVMVRTFFIQGVGMFIMITWTAAMILYLAIHLFYLAWNLETMFSETNQKRKGFALGLMAVMALGASRIPSDVAAKQLIFSLYNPLDFGWTVLLGSASFFIGWMRAKHRRRRKHWEASQS